MFKVNYNQFGQISEKTWVEDPLTEDDEIIGDLFHDMWLDADLEEREDNEHEFSPIRLIRIAEQNKIEEVTKLVNNIDTIDKNQKQTLIKNFRTKGTASHDMIYILTGVKLSLNLYFYDDMDENEKEEEKEILWKVMGVAEYRHCQTRYDDIDKSQLSDQDVASIRSSM